MNNYNNYNIVRQHKDRILNNIHPIYHSPLIFDMNTQTSYRKAGYVAWPKTTTSCVNLSREDEERRKNRSDNRPYFAYPKNKA